MDCSTPGSSVLHHLLELAQIHVHWVSDAIQPSHLLSPPSPPALNLSQHQGLFQWVSSLNHVAKRIGASGSILSMNIQGWSPLGLTGLISLLSKRLSRVFSSTTIQKHQFFSTQPSLWFSSSSLKKKKKCIYFFGRTGSLLWQVGSLVAHRFNCPVCVGS